MQAYRIKTENRIEPFGDLARDLFVSTRTLEEWQAAACIACDLELSDIDELGDLPEEPSLVFFDDVFFTEMALRNFVADALSATEDLALALPDSPSIQSLSIAVEHRRGPDQSVVFDVFALQGRKRYADRNDIRAHCSPKLQKIPAVNIKLKLPRIDGGPEQVEAQVTARIVAHVTHWLHLLRLSQMAIGVSILDHLRREPGRFFKLKWKRRLGFDRRHERNFIDPSAQVHPSAYLDTVVVGPNCVIGPHAHIHHSVLGANVVVGDHAAVMGCSLADRVQVLRASYMAHCVAMPDANLASYKVQLSLFGRGCFLTSSAKLLDAKLKGEVSVEHNDEILSVGSPFLGVCVGHRTVLGADTTIQAGRAIPNDLTIVAPPESVISKLSEVVPGSLLALRNGNLVNLGVKSVQSGKQNLTDTPGSDK